MTRARGQSGLTLLETLVMIAVTALVGAALVNVATRANTSNYARATRTLDVESMRRAEIELRRAGVAATSDVAALYSFKGDSRRVEWATTGYVGCAKGSALTRFAIEATGDGGERLVRRCRTRADVVAQWPAGARGDFAYSSDGYSWLATPPSAEPRDPGGEQGVYLRLRVRGPGRDERLSVVRLAGAADANDATSVLEAVGGP